MLSASALNPLACVRYQQCGWLGLTNICAGMGVCWNIARWNPIAISWNKLLASSPLLCLPFLSRLSENSFSCSSIFDTLPQNAAIRDHKAEASKPKMDASRLFLHPCFRCPYAPPGHAQELQIIRSSAVFTTPHALCPT